MTAHLDRAVIWKALTNRNYEGDIRAAGNTVKIPTLTSEVTDKEYMRNTDIDAPEILTFSTQDFEISQQRYFHIYVDDIDRVQARPALMDAFIARALIRSAQAADTYVGNKFYEDAAVVDARKETVGAVASALSNATDEDRATAAKTVLQALADLRNTMIKNHFALTGIMLGQGATPVNPWVVFHPDMVTLMEKYFSVLNPVTMQGIAEGTVRSGFAGQLIGFDVWTSTTVPLGTAGQVDNRYRMPAGTNQAVTYADQIAEVIPYRPERRFGDAIKALYVYDAKLVEADFLYHLEVFFDAG